MARGKDTLSEKELSIVTVRDVLVLAKHAKIEGSNGAKEDAIVKALFNAKIPAELAENINGKRKKSDNGDSDTSDSDKNSETSDAKSKKKKRTKKTPDSDKSDSCSDSDDLAVMARHTGIDHRVSEGLGRDGGRPLSFPFLWIYMFITEPQHFFVLVILHGISHTQIVPPATGSSAVEGRRRIERRGWGAVPHAGCPYHS